MAKWEKSNFKTELFWRRAACNKNIERNKKCPGSNNRTIKWQQNQSYFAADGRSVGVCQSVSPSVLVMSLSGTHNQILAVVKTVAVLSWGIVLDGRTGLFLTGHSLYVGNIQVYFHFMFSSRFILSLTTCFSSSSTLLDLQSRFCTADCT